MAGPNNSTGGKTGPLQPDDVEQYLKSNPDFLDTFVHKYVSTETIHKWMTDRSNITSSRKPSLSKWKFAYSNGLGLSPPSSSGINPNSVDKSTMLKNLALQLQRNPYVPNLLWELGVCISSAISANSFVLYLMDSETRCLRRFSQLKNSQDLQDYNLEEDMTLATYVCKLREPQIMSRVEATARFIRGLGDNNENLEKSHYVLCHPIIRADGEISGVIELHRQDSKQPFYIEDQEIVNSYLIWGGVALHYADLNTVMNKQKKQNEFLLDVVRSIVHNVIRITVYDLFSQEALIGQLRRAESEEREVKKSIFQDMISMDILIKKVMNFAQKLVDADRASLFLVDSKTRELYARLFDTGVETEPGMGTFESPQQEIRVPLGTGIAGQVAATGEILNITDAYKDQRFNREVDKLTGYVTKTILCMPIFIRGSVIGVVQMLNKRHGTFTKEDEQAFTTYAIYCGLALHHAKLYDKIRRSEQKYNVALEVLSYYNTCSEEEFENTRSIGIPSTETVFGIDDFYFNPLATDDIQKIHFAVHMFVELFGLSRFDLDSIYRFFLTVKKNYRRVPYHNWTHGFTVAHSMYCMLKRTDSFRRLERLALYVGALCHDVDHRGKNNKFMLESASPIAAIYSTSTMEHHHFNQTVTILQREGHNIFGKLSSEEYKIILSNIKHCILATDLANFFGNKAKLEHLVDTDVFNWGATDPRLLVQTIAMTAADLCASAKPWEIQLETVNVIFLEFYEQGDLEKKAGRQPNSMMDRDRAEEQPASQVGFLQGICIPCYDLLSRVIPETSPLLDGCKMNLSRWQELVEEQKEKDAAASGEASTDL